jgi:hypothetical protein
MQILRQPNQLIQTAYLKQLLKRKASQKEKKSKSISMQQQQQQHILQPIFFAVIFE